MRLSILLSISSLTAAHAAFAQESPVAPVDVPAASFPVESTQPAPTEPGTPSAPAEPGTPPAPQEPPPPLAPTPEPARARPATPVTSATPSAPIPDNQRSFYASLSLLGSFHLHGSRYEQSLGEELDQSSGGLGYEALLMMGSRKKNFVFGGAASFTYVPKSVVLWDSDEVHGYRPAMLALTVGPAVDFHAGRYFHIGGVLGLAIEQVPAFEPLPRDKDTLAGVGSGLWLGFDWRVDDHFGLGILMTGHFRQELTRDLPGPGSRENLEASLSLGLGMSLAYY